MDLVLLIYTELLLAFPYGHYRIDDKNSMAMDNMANIWRRNDLTTSSSSSSSQTGPLLLHLYNKAMDKYNYPHDSEQRQQQIGKQHEWTIYMKLKSFKLLIKLIKLLWL